MIQITLTYLPVTFTATGYIYIKRMSEFTYTYSHLTMISTRDIMTPRFRNKSNRKVSIMTGSNSLKFYSRGKSGKVSLLRAVRVRCKSKPCNYGNQYKVNTFVELRFVGNTITATIISPQSPLFNIFLVCVACVNLNVCYFQTSTETKYVYT